jgi:multiple sugar transport system substrate-binding protein
MKSKTGLKSLAAALGFVSFVTLGGAIKASAEDVVLHMAVPDWPPTRIMKEMFDKEYKPASGNKVTLDLDFIPWPDSTPVSTLR